MLTDWVLIARLAAELDDRLRGARVRDAGMLADGRVGIGLRRRGDASALGIEPFSSPPAITLEDGPTEMMTQSGFARTLADSLDGMAIRIVSARRYDRLVRMSFGARSKFGVCDEAELYIELVPRFGNVILVKGERVIGALKEFSPSEKGRRSIVVGQRYEFPPLPERPRTLAPSSLEGDALRDAPVHVYRRGVRIAQAYLVPLTGFDDAQHAIEGSVLRVFSTLHAERLHDAGSLRGERRRGTLLRRLEQRERKTRAELASLAAKKRRAQDREVLRREGEAIFATLHERTPNEREALKDRAEALFSEYKKFGKSLPHIESRVSHLNALLEAVETLRWEAERARDEDFADVESASAQLEPRPHRAARATAPARRRRAILEFRTAHGSRILVGRSPFENAELTFHVARPDDLWFHAQGIPGAHVILARDDRSAPPSEDVTTAAELAAFHSKAKANATVPVDYTRRKHVRKQRAAPPGLVWYTHAQTIVVAPKAFG